MCGSCHIWNVLIGVKYWNCCQTLDGYILLAIWMEPIRSKLIYLWVNQFWSICNLWTDQLVSYKSVIKFLINLPQHNSKFWRQFQYSMSIRTLEPHICTFFLPTYWFMMLPTYLIMIKLCENKIIKAITFVLRLKHLLLYGSKIAMIVDQIVESFYPPGPLKLLSFYLSTSLLIYDVTYVFDYDATNVKWLNSRSLL